MVGIKIMCMELHSRMQSVESLSGVPDVLDDVLDKWEEAVDEDDHPFDRWPDFRAYKSPWGLGIEDWHVLEDICNRYDKGGVADKLSKAEQKQPGRPPKESTNNGSRFKSDKPNKRRNVIQGNTRSYNRSRLAKHDAEHGTDWLERVNNKELSAYRACIEAGIIKEKTKLEKAVAAFNKLTDSEQRKFFKLVAESEG